MSRQALEALLRAGASLVGDWIDERTERRLLMEIDASPWCTDLKRRTQHYGWRYDYKARRVDASMRLDGLPAWATDLGDRMKAEGYCASQPDQVIVNEYLPGQGIASHIDCVPCFGPTILSLSLGSSCVIELSALESQPHSIALRPRSLLVLSGDARARWAHRIPSRKSDVISGTRVPRARRVSLTFRTVSLEVR